VDEAVVPVLRQSIATVKRLVTSAPPNPRWAARDRAYAQTLLHRFESAWTTDPPTAKEVLNDLDEVLTKLQPPESTVVRACLQSIRNWLHEPEG
jgi:hypothetical protein